MATNSTTAELDELIAQEEEQLRAAFARVAARGGLPTQSDVQALTAQLGELIDKVETHAMAAEAFSHWTQGDQVPFVISHENVAALALLVDLVDDEIAELRTLSEGISSNLFMVELARRAQPLRSGGIAQANPVEGDGADG